MNNETKYFLQTSYSREKALTEYGGYAEIEDRRLAVRVSDHPKKAMLRSPYKSAVIAGYEYDSNGERTWLSVRKAETIIHSLFPSVITIPTFGGWMDKDAKVEEHGLLIQFKGSFALSDGLLWEAGNAIRIALHQASVLMIGPDGIVSFIEK